MTPPPRPNPATTARQKPDLITIHSSAERQNLQLLIRLRWIAISGQTAAILVTHFALSIALPLAPMLAVLLGLVAVNLFAHWRLRWPAPITVPLLASEILIDVLALTALFYMSGGANNPFLGLFILQDIVALNLLPLRAAAVVFGVTLAAGFFLLGFGRPLYLRLTPEDGPSFDDLHLIGVYLSFVISAGLTLWFMLGVRRNLARRDAELARVQRQIEEEQTVIRLGLMASTAAHDLGTPLTNLAVILDDWADLGLPPPDELREQAKLMQEAVAACRETISGLLRQAGQARLEAAASRDAAGFLRDLLADWGRSHRPQVTLRDLRTRASRIVADVLLTRAVANLLDNAEQAGAQNIWVEVQGSADQVVITLCDDGPGYPAQLLDQGPVAFASGNAEPGRGLGLILVQSVLRRLGGALLLRRAPGGGACAVIELPAARGG